MTTVIVISSRVRAVFTLVVFNSIRISSVPSRYSERKMTLFKKEKIISLVPKICFCSDSDLELFLDLFEGLILKKITFCALVSSLVLKISARFWAKQAQEISFFLFKYLKNG